MVGSGLMAPKSALDLLHNLELLWLCKQILYTMFLAIGYDWRIWGLSSSR